MLLASVQLPVKTILFSRAPRWAATCARALVTAAWARFPCTCSTLEALPKTSVKYGSMASSTRRSTGVVALWSR